MCVCIYIMCIYVCMCIYIMLLTGGICQIFQIFSEFVLTLAKTIEG